MSAAMSRNEKFEGRWDERLGARKLIIVPNPTDERMTRFDEAFSADSYLVVPSRPFPSDEIEAIKYKEQTIAHLCRV